MSKHRSRNKNKGRANNQRDHGMAPLPSVETSPKIEPQIQNSESHQETAANGKEPQRPSWLASWIRAVSPTDVVITFATVVIAISTVYYTGYAKKQWLTMGEQRREMRFALDSSWDHFVIEQRPWVMVSRFELLEQGDKLTARLTYVNTGKTPAIRLSFVAKPFFYVPENQIVLDLQSIFGFPKRPLVGTAPETNLPPASGANDGIATFETEAFPVEPIAKYKAGKLAAYIETKIWYSDVFTTKDHWSQQCAFHKFSDPPNAWRLCAAKGDGVDQELHKEYK